MSLLLTVAILCVAGAKAQNATGNSTTPEHLGWVPASPGRSTMDIVWTCVSVLLICSYKCIHVNIPSFKEKRATWHRLCGIPVWPELPLIRKAYRKVYLMGTILIAPELGVGMAIDQYLGAKAAVDEARKAVPELEWTLTHGYYSIMGGFGTLPQTPKAAMSRVPSRTLQPDESAAFLTPAEQISRSPGSPHMSGHRISIEERDMEDDGASTRKLITTTFNPSRIRSISLASYGKICRTLPSDSDLIVTEDNLNDRSKSDLITKAFAILQSTWLIVQSINRVAHGLPITELELATMAYVLCAIVMYGLWWYKPFDAEHIVVVPLPTGPEGAGITSLPWKRVEDVTVKIMDDVLDIDSYRTPGIRHAMFYGTGTAFAAIHLAAWNWEFPSPPVAILWRVFSTVATAAGVELMTQGLLVYYLNISSGITDLIFSWLFGISMVLYIIARLGIIVLVFYSFKSMPAAVYDTPPSLWPSYFPHFS